MKVNDEYELILSSQFIKNEILNSFIDLFKYRKVFT